MRPRVIPAEDLMGGKAKRSVIGPGFNEAAGNPRGRRSALYSHAHAPTRLQ